MGKVTSKEVQDLIDALSAGSCAMIDMDPMTRKLFDTLRKLGLSKAPNHLTYGAPLKVENLEVTLKKAWDHMLEDLKDMK